MSQKPRFLPWIGKRYESGGVLGVRLLLLGESMYDRAGTLKPDIVRKMIEDQIHGRQTRRAYTLIHRTVGELFNPSDFWHSVMFYNFVQSAVGDRPQHRPSATAREDSKAAMLAIVECHTPQAVLVLGKELWQWLIALGLVSETGAGVGKIEASSAPKAAYIHHPSSRGFKPEKWRETVNTLLGRVV